MDPSVVSTLIQGGGTAAVVGLLFYVWRGAESRADKLQLERDALLERVLLGLSSATQSTKEVANTANSLLSALQSLTEVVRERGK